MLDSWPGYCAVCECAVVFQEYGPWHRDQLVCGSCGSIPRQRALMAVLEIFQPLWRASRIWELAPAGPASAKLRTECADYTSSHFWPDVPLGSMVAGVRCEDLERPTLADSCMDVIVSSDVFEHIVDVDAALAQVARVLVADGIHVWTTPQYRDRAVSAARVNRVNGSLEYLVPPEYHGDPVNAGGALVTFDWGRDLPDRVAAASGLETTVVRLESRRHGLLGEFLEVFVSRRGPLGAIGSDRASQGRVIEASSPRASGTVDASRGGRANGSSWTQLVAGPLREIARAVRRRGDPEG